MMHRINRYPPPRINRHRPTRINRYPPHASTTNRSRVRSWAADLEDQVTRMKADARLKPHVGLHTEEALAHRKTNDGASRKRGHDNLVRWSQSQRWFKSDSVPDSDFKCEWPRCFVAGSTAVKMSPRSDASKIGSSPAFVHVLIGCSHCSLSSVRLRRLGLSSGIWPRWRQRPLNDRTFSSSL